MAPLRGVNVAAYRACFARHFGGVDVVVAPFVPVGATPNTRSSLLADVLPENNAGLPVIPQVIGRDPDALLTVCRALTDLGYEEVNWNLGCPWRMVVKRHRGSGLLPHPDLIRAVLDRLVPEMSGRLSVKARLGVDRPDQLLPLIPMLNAYPLKEVTIHPRTARQMYDGEVHLDMFETCRRAFTLPVVYNGDIRTVDDFRKLSDRFPDMNRWMLGRGLIANPFLAMEIAGTALPTDRCGTIRAFHDELYALYREELSGPAPVLGRMKELWFYLSRSFHEGAQGLKRIQRTRTFEQYESSVDRLFARRPAATI